MQEREGVESPEQAREASGRTVDFELAWFFLPLPHPIGMPHGDIVEGARLPRYGEIRQWGAFTPRITWSVKFHQTDRESNPSLDLVEDLFALANAATEGVDASRGATPSSPPSHFTVAEVAIPISDRDTVTLSDAFDTAVEALRHVQRAYAMTTQSVVELASHETMPVVVPLVIAQPNLGEQPPEPQAMLAFEINPRDLHRSYEPPPLDEEALAGLQVVLDHSSRAGAFFPFAELRREGWTQRYVHGNRRVAVLIMSIACEVLLDTTLRHLLWEEGLSPEEAAQVFSFECPHAKRVLSDFHGRIGGSWRPGHGTIGRYLDALRPLRHRVTHAGREPSREEMQETFDIHLELERFLGDRLASHRGLAHYPRTAWAFLGPQGLDRRNRLTTRMEEITADPKEPNWVSSFAAWNRLVERAVEDSPPDPGDDWDELDLLIRVQEGQEPSWWLIDSDEAHASRVDPRHLGIGPESRERFERSATQLQKDQGTQIEGGLVPFEPPDQLPSLDWRPVLEAFPEMRPRFPND